MHHDGVRGGPTLLHAARLADWIAPVSRQRISQVIVDQIRLQIQQGRLKPGDRLPNERDLGVRFGVSRSTVREARRILEAHGLIEVNGGVQGEPS